MTLPATLPVDDYRIRVEIDSGGAVAESDEANNTVVTSDVIKVAGEFVDLVPTISTAKLPDVVTSGDGTKIKLPLFVTNGGNNSLAKGQKADIQIFIRPEDAVDDSQDVLVTTAPNLSVSNLGSAKTKKFNVNVQLPAGLPTDDYVLASKVVLEIGGPGTSPDADETNNTMTTSVNDPIYVKHGVIDLVGSLGSISLPSVVSAASGEKGKVIVTITNNGTVVAATGLKIDI